MVTLKEAVCTRPVSAASEAMPRVRTAIEEYDHRTNPAIADSANAIATRRGLAISTSDRLARLSAVRRDENPITFRKSSSRSASNVPQM